MAEYIDGFVLPLPKRKLPAYRKLAALAAKVYTELGALDYCECVSDALEVPFGLRFDKLAKTKKGEIVVFAWIVYRSRADRDRISARVMTDPRMTAVCDPAKLPFDCSRMSWAGFSLLVAGGKRRRK